MKPDFEREARGPRPPLKTATNALRCLKRMVVEHGELPDTLRADMLAYIEKTRVRLVGDPDSRHRHAETANHGV